jgi:hypothetical protein
MATFEVGSLEGLYAHKTTVHPIGPSGQEGTNSGEKASPRQRVHVRSREKAERGRVCAFTKAQRQISMRKISMSIKAVEKKLLTMPKMGEGYLETNAPGSEPP